MKTFACMMMLASLSFWAVGCGGEKDKDKDKDKPAATDAPATTDTPVKVEGGEPIDPATLGDGSATDGTPSDESATDGALSDGAATDGASAPPIGLDLDLPDPDIGAPSGLTPEATDGA